jgi:hypothetical protein
MNPTLAQPRPVEDDAGLRVFAILGGYGLMGAGLAIAWFGAAGVTTSTTNFDSGPTAASLTLLLGVFALILAGAYVVTIYGSIYGRVHAKGILGVLYGGWNLNRTAVFFGNLGGGLLLLGLLLPLSDPGVGCGPLFISPSVLIVPETLDGVALGSLAIGISLLVVGRFRGPNEFRAWWRRSGRYVGVTSVAILVIVAGLVLVPVRQSFSLQLDIGGGNGYFVGGPYEALPPGTSISGNWAASPAGVVNFSIQAESGPVLYSANASSGTFSVSYYRTPQSVYFFLARATAPENVSIHVTYFEPTWPWPPGEPGSPTIGLSQAPSCTVFT